MIKHLSHSLFRDSNNQEVSRNVLYTMIIKGCAMLISVLAVPAYVRYFDNDIVYGAWLTIAAVFTWINLFDFGIGNGLRNYLVKAISEKDENASKKFVSSAYVSIGLVSLFFLIAGLCVSYAVNWNSVLKVSELLIAPTVFRRFIQVVFCGVVIHFFFVLIHSIFYAIQRTFWPNLLSLITQILILLYIIFPNHASLSVKLKGLSTVYALAYNLPLLTASLVLFSGKLKAFRPSFKFFNWKFSKKLLGLGGIFFVIQIALIALNSSNEVYINSFFSPAEVTQYNYYHKLFYIISVFVSLLSQPIWSAITKAYCEKRYRWIMGMWKVLVAIAALCIIGCIALAALYQPIADLWLGKGRLTVTIMPVTLFAIMTIQMAIINLSNSLSNGLGKIKIQAIFTAAGAILKFPLSWILAQAMNVWYAVILATVIASLPLMIIQPIYIFRVVSNLNGKKTVSADEMKEKAADKDSFQQAGV